MTFKIDHRQTLLAQFDGLKSQPMFQAMQRTVENSPWHREDSVGIHTEMVVDEYVKLIDSHNKDTSSDLIPWTRLQYLGGIAAVFHDVGKPPAEQKKFSESRGEYRGYGGHELLSARMFEDYAVRRYPMFTAEEIFVITWMIEQHLYYAATDDKKQQMVKTVCTFKPLLVSFSDLLLADQFGRISDDPDKNNKALSSVREFEIMCVKELTERYQLKDIQREGQPTMYMPIAPSGAGKSTYFRKLKAEKPTIQSFSLDALRHEFYHPTDYKIAYQKAVDDKSFESRANARFHAMLKQCNQDKTDLYCDNTNLSTKRRRHYIEAARKLGFRVVAVTMPVALDTLLERQRTRGDKQVPDAAVRQHYNSLQQPMIGEFDEIIVSDHNLVKQ